MILILTLLSLFLCTTIYVEKVEAKDFSYQFILPNNSIDINLDSFTVIELPTTDDSVAASLFDKILSFDYRIKKTKNLPSDLPLFIVTFGQEIIFAADASLADDLIHRVQLDLEPFGENYFTTLPIFYRNNDLHDFELDLDNLAFSDEMVNPKNNVLQIEDLSAIRESDQSLTVLFSLKEEVKNQHFYQLFCLNDQEEIIHSVELVETDNFLWPTFTFLGFFTNQKNELIFHLKKFECEGLLYVADHFGAKSNQVSIVAVKDL